MIFRCHLKIITYVAILEPMVSGGGGGLWCGDGILNCISFLVLFPNLKVRNINNAIPTMISTHSMGFHS